MKCEKFWDDASELIFGNTAKWDSIPDHLQSHLDICPKCRKEFMLISTGLDALNKEIHMEESGPFWHSMKQEIKKQVGIPRRRISFRLNFFSPRGLTWATAVLLVLMFVFRWSVFTGPSLTSQDLMVMFGNDPIVSLYDQSSPDIISPGQTDPDPYVYAGLIDAWTVLLAETYENHNHDGRSLKFKKDSHKRDISSVFFYNETVG